MSSSLSQDYVDWRREAIEQLPDLARRVFDLRGEPYANAEYQNRLEMRLGGLIRILNDDRTSPVTQLAHISNRAMFDEIEAEVVKAESEIQQAYDARRQLLADQNIARLGL